ncbi:MAG: M protein, serotype 5 [Parcubacteria group bacterium GW2011_GWA2_51_10]|nr:MAG: M protein, serotype 5 [Parcubacteria group bacterium GW2011_GWA2_51_10]
METMSMERYSGARFGIHNGASVATLLILLAILTAPYPVNAQDMPTMGCGPGKEVKDVPSPDGGSPGQICVYKGTGQYAGQLIRADDTQALKCGFPDFFSNITFCVWNAAAAGIGSVLISATAWLLAIASYLFDWLVIHTIVEFGAKGELYDQVKSGVESAWTVLRDLSNILIIGVFAFIAVSIILGLKEFGQKKLIANVLIIAVLINFSLLFTKIIIDASNFTARQFYQSSKIVQPQTGTNLGISPIETGYSNVGVSGSFMQLMGVASIGHTFKALETAAARQDSWWLAIVYGLFGAAVLLGATLVLLYGSFLLLSRALLLIFLMLTSAIAFASYLIPKAAQSGFGWSTWWSSLLKAAVFAPLLMIFLWITIMIGQGLTKTKDGTLGGLLTQMNDSNMGALFSYLIVLGLLFASIRVSNSFAKGIAGFNFSSSILAAPFTLSSQLIGGPLGRKIFGRSHASEALYLGTQIDKEKADVARRRVESEMSNRPFDEMKENSRLIQLLKQKEKQEEKAKASYNVMNRASAKTLVTGLGVSGIVSGADNKPTSFAETSTARAQAAAAKAAETTISKDEAATYLQDRSRERREDLELTKKQHQELIRTLSKKADEQKTAEGIEDRRVAAKDELEKAQENAALEKGRISNEYNTGRKTRADYDAEIQAQDNIIRAARKKVDLAENRITEIESPIKNAEEQMKKTEEQITNLNKAIESEAKKMATASAENARDVAANIARGNLNRFGNVMRRSVGLELKDDVFAQKARGQAKKKIKAKKYKEELDAKQEIVDEAEGKSGESETEKH